MNTKSRPTPWAIINRDWELEKRAFEADLRGGPSIRAFKAEPQSGPLIFKVDFRSRPSKWR